MGAVRISNVIYSKVENVRYLVEIWDSDYGGSAITTFRDNGFQLSYAGATDNFTEPILSSTFKYQLYDDGSGDFISFKTDITSAQENEFKLICYKDVTGSGTYQLFWAGVIMADLISWDNDNTPRLFTIIAKDGLNRLANIEFDKILTTPYLIVDVSYPQTVLKIIYDLLSYTETSQFWDSTPDEYIKVQTTWKDTQMILDNSTTAKIQSRSLELVRLDPNFMYDHSEDQGIGSKVILIRNPDDKPLKGKTLLKELLQMLGLRILLSEGHWWIQQISNLTAATPTYANYDKSLGFINSGTETMRVAPSVVSDGVFAYAPSVRIARAQILPTDIMNISEYSDYTIDKNTLTRTDTIQLNTLYGGSGSGLSLAFDYSVKIDAWDKTYGVAYNVLVTIKLVATDSGAVTRRLYMRNVVAPGTVVAAAGVQIQWTTTAADNIQFTLNPYDNANKEFMVQIKTPEIPFTKADNCYIELTTEITGGTPYLSAEKARVTVHPFKIELIDAANPSGMITEIQSVNPSVNTYNSMDIDFGNLRIHDSGGISSKNSFEIDEYVGAGRWTKSGVWNAGFGTNTTLVRTILKNAVALQRTPIDKYQGAFRGYLYNAWNVLTYDSSYWVFMSGTFDSNTSEWDGEWFEIVHNPTGVLGETDLTKDVVGDNGKVRPLNPWDVGLPKMTWRPPLDGNTNFPIEKGRISGTYQTTGGAITSINVYSVDYAHLRSGDYINLINPTTREVIDTFILSADVAQGATSISISSDTPASDVSIGTELSVNSNDLFITEKSRTIVSNELGRPSSYYREFVLSGQSTSTTPVELTTNGLSASGSANRVLVPTDYGVLFMIYIVGVKSGETETCAFVRHYLVNNNGGTTTERESTPTEDIDMINDLACSVTMGVNDTYDAITVTVTGLSVTTINWTAIVKGYYTK